MQTSVQKSFGETRHFLPLRWLIDQISAYVEQCKTIQALKACREHDLKDAGLIPHDIAELKGSPATDAVDRLCRSAGVRAGNW